MNNINLQQVGGFPLETDTLEFMQNAYSALQNIAALGGDNYILSGCITSGSNTSNGYVVIAGEVLPFKGGLTQSHIIINETKTQKVFANGKKQDVFISRNVTFGAGADAIDFNSLSRLMDVKTLTDEIAKRALITDVAALNTTIQAYIPKGVIWMWSGSINSIPAGFGLCDGTNGRPDLRNRFVVGAGDSYPAGATGGSKDAVVVAHTHNATATSNGDHVHTFVGDDQLSKFHTIADSSLYLYDAQSQYAKSYSRRYETTSAGTHTHTISVSNAGQSGTNANLPPYYALAYIIKL